MLMMLEHPPKTLSVGKITKRVPSRYARIPKGMPYPNRPMVQIRAELFRGLPK